jgi:RNA polymerase sigma-54 factor
VVDEKQDNVEDFERLDELDRELPDFFDDSPRRSGNQISEDADRRHDQFANIAARPESLHDYLLHQLGELDLDPEVREIAERIISTLDPQDGGYFRSSLEDLLPPRADRQRLKLAREALAVVQSLDPPGIAARDLRECLLLQLSPDMPFYDELRTIISEPSGRPARQSLAGDQTQDRVLDRAHPGDVGRIAQIESQAGGRVHRIVSCRPPRRMCKWKKAKTESTT